MSFQVEPTGASYAGPERRVHRVYVTRNTEYHTRAGLCVAVRDRRTGAWLHEHPTLGHPVRGAIAFQSNGAMVPHRGEPRPGDSLYFRDRAHDIVTSAIERIERPARDTVVQYPST